MTENEKAESKGKRRTRIMKKIIIKNMIMIKSKNRKGSKSNDRK